jgi:hypothetical protein
MAQKVNADMVIELKDFVGKRRKILEMTEESVVHEKPVALQ